MLSLWPPDFCPISIQSLLYMPKHLIFTPKSQLFTPISIFFYSNVPVTYVDGYP